MKGEAELDKDKVEEGPDQITPHPVKADDKTSLMNDVTGSLFRTSALRRRRIVLIEMPFLAHSFMLKKLYIFC